MKTQERESILTSKTTGAHALIQALLEEGVRVVFGYPGAATIPIHDILVESPIRHILTRHEQGAAHAADGYARASGRVGVCLATSGPGALNLVTGIATAYMDSVPIVAITGQVATYKLGTDAFQEADTTGVTEPIVKHSYLVKEPGDIPSIVQEAFHIASTGRPGPVLIDIPLDVSLGEAEYRKPSDIGLRSYRPTLTGHPLQIRKAVQLIDSASKPLICVGGGVIASSATHALSLLIQKADIPVVYTLMGKGAFPDAHPMNFGLVGMHGAACANYATRACDLLIAIGMRFSDRTTGRTAEFAPNAHIIHIDIDPAEIGKMRRPTVPIVGDAGSVVDALASKVTQASHAEWVAQLDQWRKAHQPNRESEDGIIMPWEILDVINDLTGSESIITTDVGQHQMWAAQLCRVSYPRHFLSSGGLGTMGYGFPAAIGAQVACPDKVVFVITGDGSFLMNSQEIMTAVEQRLPIKIALFNNGYLGMVRQWQQIFYSRRYAATDISAQPDFVKLAEAYGAVGIRVTKPEDIPTAVRQSLEVCDMPCLMDFRIAREANVLPMIPAGGTVDDMLLELD